MDCKSLSQKDNVISTLLRLYDRGKSGEMHEPLSTPATNQSPPHGKSDENASYHKAMCWVTQMAHLHIGI